MLISITNRELTNGDFLKKIDEIAKGNPYKIILREKDLDKNDYSNLLNQVIPITNKYNVDLAIHSHIDIAKSHKIKSIHLPFNQFKENYESYESYENYENINNSSKTYNKHLKYFDAVGVSIHSIEEAVYAENNGANYIIAGHIFPTESKKRLKEKGLKFLEELKFATKIDIYAIGGINISNLDSVLKTGVKGIAIMSDLMQSNTPYQKILDYKNQFKKKRN
ncbi:thiamine phosphate synthase [Methanobrevibacter curvatus]|uniref:Regulatory protein TenI n=1 Tax=Methanobrevibacter curvatus TaxID=49547 RepID=A0A165YY31_9EURY|nr:thiamine phosphate synthase [Methanobrevibacter curvatus]KZX10008.1 regulatory protein TenI [Methanobrevibacter curvatus]